MLCFPVTRGLPRLFTLTFGLLTLGAASVSAAPDSSSHAFALLARALRSRRALAYSARQIIDIASPDPRLESTHLIADIVHDGDKSLVVYRFPPDVAGRAIADDGAHTDQFEPGRGYRIVGVSASRQEENAGLPKMLTLLRKNYVCAMERRESLAGRECDVLTVRPKREPGPRKRYWIDKKTRAILRTEEYDDDGCRLNVSAYESIQFFPHAAPEKLTLPPNVRALPARPSAATPAAVQSWERAAAQSGIDAKSPAWLPAGYAPLGVAILGKRGGGKAILTRYGDGLETLTIFEESAQNLPSAARHQERLNRGLARYGRQAWASDVDGTRISVIGDVTVPDAVGKEFLASLSAQSEKKLAHAATAAFGADAGARAKRLRSRGWSYPQIAALQLCLKAHPSWRARVQSAWTATPSIPAFAAPYESPARAWVSRALTAKF